MSPRDGKGADRPAAQGLDTTDEDLKQADAPPVVKLAAALCAVSGVFVALSGLQVLGVRFRTDWIEYIPYLQLSAGVAQIGLGAMIFRARPWAVYAEAGLGVLVALGMTGWFVFFLVGVGLSCMVVIAPPVSAVAAVLTFLAVPGVRKTAAARQRLAERGLGLGL